VSPPREGASSRIRGLRRGPRSAADLRIRFLVDSGRYPSIFDVMRDIRGTTGPPEDYNHPLRRLRTEGVLGSSRLRSLFSLSLSLHPLTMWHAGDPATQAEFRSVAHRAVFV
jgi:hypothetical protein